MSIDEQKELKPCPFCGAQPRLTKSGTEMPYMTSLVRCKCGVTFGDVGHDVASKWNKRHTPAQDVPFDYENPMDYTELRDFYIMHNGTVED